MRCSGCRRAATRSDATAARYPAPRTLADAFLTEKITDVHDASRGTYGRREGTPSWCSASVHHLSGSLGLDVLGMHPRRASLHPLVPLPDAEVGAQRLLDGATFAVNGDPLAGRMAAALGGRIVEVDDARCASPTTPLRASPPIMWSPCSARSNVSPPRSVSASTPSSASPELPSTTSPAWPTSRAHRARVPSGLGHRAPAPGRALPRGATGIPGGSRAGNAPGRRGRAGSNTRSRWRGLGQRLAAERDVRRGARGRVS